MDTTLQVTVGIIRYKPQVQLTIPMNMYGPMVMTVDAAVKLRDELDKAIKEFKWNEGKPELVSPCGSCKHLFSRPEAPHQVVCEKGETSDMVADFSCYEEDK